MPNPPYSKSNFASGAGVNATTPKKSIKLGFDLEQEDTVVIKFR